MRKTFYLYHTNDIHSHFEHWAQIVHYLKSERQRHQQQGDAVFQFDIGDHIDRFHPATESSMGQDNVKLLNDVGYDGVTIGNNEGITLAKADLERLYQKANFPVLVANLFNKQGNRPATMKPYQFYAVNHGLTIGVIGVTVAFSVFYEALGWQVSDPLALLPELVAEVRQQADIVILLSHMGYSYDQRAAETIPGIDAILGGHTHHLLREGTIINGTVISQAGKFGDYVGRMALTYETDSNQLINIDSRCLPIEEGFADEAVNRQVKTLTEQGEQDLQKTVTYLSSPMLVSWYQPSELPERLAEAVKMWCDADISMVNAGVLLDSLPAGAVTQADLHRICPHPINPCSIQLTGAQVRELVRQASRKDMEHMRIVGLGFRGEVMGRTTFAGLDIERDDGVVQQITYKGQPILDEELYVLATLDMFTLGKIFPKLKDTNPEYFLPEMLRDILAWMLASPENAGQPSLTADSYVRR